MQLSKKILSQLNGTVQSVPAKEFFELPEKVLQFGTGVLLSALPDYYIDKANKQGIFNGRFLCCWAEGERSTDETSSPF